MSPFPLSAQRQAASCARECGSHDTSLGAAEAGRGFGTGPTPIQQEPAQPQSSVSLPATAALLLIGLWLYFLKTSPGLGHQGQGHPPPLPSLYVQPLPLALSPGGQTSWVEAAGRCLFLSLPQAGSHPIISPRLPGTWWAEVTCLVGAGGEWRMGRWRTGQLGGESVAIIGGRGPQATELGSWAGWSERTGGTAGRGSGC